MTTVTLLDIIADPIMGPYEGEDFWIDPDGTIQVPDNNISLAANIMRKTNASGEFTDRLVKIGQRGDSILLAFDTLASAEPVYSIRIGYKQAILAEVKRDDNGKFCVYLDRKRSARLFAKLLSAKSFLKKLDKELQSQGQDVATYEESED